MLNYRYFKQALLFVMLFVSFSCRKDLGNYNYEEINAVDFGGMEKAYNALLGEKFKVSPVLKFTKDDTNDEQAYSYQWFAMKNGESLNSEIRKELATTRNLDIVVKIPSGIYDVYYIVTDKKTGVAYRTSFKLTVQTNIYEGWMVLNDVNGAARLDMVSKVNEVYTPVTDVLTSTGSELTLKGKPLDVHCYQFSFSNYGIYLSTDKGTNRVDPETFKWKNTLNIKYEMVANVPDDFHADFMASTEHPQGAGTSYMFSAGNVYYYYYVYQINYGVPINLVKEEAVPFKAAPFIARSLSSASLMPNAVLFDVDKKRFVRHINNESTCTTMPTMDNALFDYNNVGKNLVYMEYSPFNGGDVFAILKGGDGKIFLARFNLVTAIQTYYAEITGAEIGNAEKFAINPTYGYLFYNAGGKVYEYDMSLKTSKLMIDKGAEKISLLKFQKFTKAGSSRPYYESRQNQLMVCSYDAALPAERNGKMELYTVPSLNGDLTLGESYSGFGKIVSVSYRER